MTAPSSTLLPQTLDRTPGEAALRPDADDARVLSLLQMRTDVTEQFFETHANRIATLCHRAAERFARGGRLIALGCSPADRSDVRHVTVEFIHPVIVGKRALPAIGITPEAGSLADQAVLLVEPDDVVIAFGGYNEGGENVRAITTTLIAALAVARAHGALTIAFADVDAEWAFIPTVCDPFVRQELTETLYHIVWELVHVFFEHRGVLSSDHLDATSLGAGASSFLYPFLACQEDTVESVIADVRRSVVMKAQEITALRIHAIQPSVDALVEAAQLLRTAFRTGHTAIALGNGGSATDAMDAVADLRSPPAGMTAYRALDLTEDTAVLTAIANDIGADAIFSRQMIAYGRQGDVVIAFSTSGTSRNVIQALDEARRRGLSSIAFVGYDGGAIQANHLADVVIVSPSQYIPRIQEAHATAWHVIRTLVG